MPNKFDKSKLKKEEKEEEEQKPLPFRYKDRLILLHRGMLPWSLLEGLNIINCGYCGKPVRVFASKSFSTRKVPRNVTLYYMCMNRCENTTMHRTSFIDRKIMALIKKRMDALNITPRIDDPLLEMLPIFEQRTALLTERRSLLASLPIAGDRSPETINEIDKVESEVDAIDSDIKSFYGKPLEENPLIAIMHYHSPDELSELDIELSRALVRFFVIRIRYFNEFLLVRFRVLTEQEDKVTKGFGPQLGINMRAVRRHNL